MNREAIARYILTGLLICGGVALLVMDRPVPEWYVALASLAVGNTFRLQVTAPKK